MIRVIFFSCFILISNSCSVVKKDSEYINNLDLCEKIEYFRKNYNTKSKQLKKYSDFIKIISEIEIGTNIKSNTIKGIGGISYTSNINIRNDIKKWELVCLNARLLPARPSIPLVPIK